MVFFKSVVENTHLLSKGLLVCTNYLTHLCIQLATVALVPHYVNHYFTKESFVF